MLALVIAVSAVLATGSAQSATNRFPDGFLLGATTAAYQIEGGWDEDGEMSEFGDIKTRANVYRFSISWPRILPTGDLDVINQPGIDYYNNLINELLGNGIQPLVTMYHWDLPQALQYLGGWPNELMADYFVEYARILFENFGDRVKWWITFNEPAYFSNAYASVGFAPSQNASGIGGYLSTHTVIKAHARVWHLYDEQYRATQNVYMRMKELRRMTVLQAGRLIGLNHYSTDFVTSGEKGTSPSKSRDSGVVTSRNEVTITTYASERI
ncbi:myrosinase 1-like [Schistocerca americana]|uniref:myrosinase 1-like n=1 Tax=Schistocerca americana TaxID=7009 RepID=UPI001F4F6DC1|nr:myrosinase 1-like [Schistocerca americana]